MALESCRTARIAVDMRPLLAARTGVGKYQASLMRAVMQLASGVDYIGFGGFNWTPIEAAHLDLTQQRASGGRAISSLIAKLPFARTAYRASQSAAYRLTLPSQRLDFFHAFLYRPPAFSTLPFLPVVYDLSNKRLPQHHPIERIRWMSKLDRYISQAPLVHTISEFSADEIVDVYGVPREKIVVVSPGVDEVFLKAAEARGTLLKYGLQSNNFFLSIGTLEPRKNIATLVRAYANAPLVLQQKFPLVLVGMKGWAESIPPEGQRLLQSGALRILGYVSDEELRDLYASACAMFYPSIYEGFGMPIAEAAAVGARVIASDIPPHHEASGGRATFVAALDIDGWRAALCNASQIGEPFVVQSGNTHTWRRAAETTLAMYRRIQKN